MKKVLLLSVLVISLIGCVGYIAYANQPKPPQLPKQHIFTPEELLAEANKLRAEKGVAPLRLDARLNQSAQWKADDMAQYDYFGHIREGYHGYQKARELAADCKLVGENIEKQSDDDITSPVDWWKNSKPHFDAMINPANDLTGYGTAVHKGIVIYVQHFCDM